MARKNNEVVNTAIITPDKHFPIHDERAINIVCKAIEIVKPNIYIDLGDTGEWEYFSNHYWKGRNAKPMEDLIDEEALGETDGELKELYLYEEGIKPEGIRAIMQGLI